jgi:hypothetical protein
MPVPKALVIAALVPRTVTACVVLPSTVRPAPFAQAVTAFTWAAVVPNRAWYCAAVRNRP